MPAFNLTPRQRRALRALDWLYDTSDETRRTGRSTVLALSYLRRLVFQRQLLDREGWIDVEDHIDMRDVHRMVTRHIMELAEQHGFFGIEVHPSGTRIRLNRGARIPDEFIQAITEFGDLPEDALQPPPQHRTMRSTTTLPSGVVVITEAPVLPPAPTTLWEHLIESV